MLENRIKQHSYSGHISYLNHRVADITLKVAVYYVQGLGMGDGQRFAMVFGRHIVSFDVLKVWRTPDFVTTPLRVGSVEIPEDLDGQREMLKDIFAKALAVYDQKYSFTLCGPTQLVLDYQDTRWKIIPRDFSWLFWKEKLAAIWSKNKLKLRLAGNYLTCPLLMLMLLALLAYLLLTGFDVPIWSIVVVAAWFFHCLDRYDDDDRFTYWLVGITKIKSKNSLASMAKLAQISQRLMNPVPLRALTVHVRLERENAKFCTIQLKNNSWFFVPYVSIGGSGIASTVAPGFTESLRAQNNGAIDTKKLDVVYPSLVRKWLLPWQTVHWKINLLDEFPMHRTPTQIAAFVNISKRASGEKKHRPNSFLLPVTVSEHGIL